MRWKSILIACFICNSKVPSNFFLQFTMFHAHLKMVFFKLKIIGIFTLKNPCLLEKDLIWDEKRISCLEEIDDQFKRFHAKSVKVVLLQSYINQLKKFQVYFQIKELPAYFKLSSSEIISILWLEKLSFSD